MSRRNWLSAFSSIWLAVAVCTADAQPIGDDPGSNAGANQAQTKPQTDQTPIILDAIERGIDRITGALEALKTEPKGATEEGRAERDLAAQESMAYWAMLMFWSTIGSLILTAVGVLLITGTLVYTKRAAVAAANAAEHGRTAAIASTTAADAARDSADALPILERAYLFVGIDLIPHKRGPNERMLIPLGRTDIDLTKHFIGIRAMMRVTNYGKTPAFIREMRFSLSLIPNPLNIPSYGDSFIDREIVIPESCEYPPPREPVEDTLDAIDGEVIRMPVPYDINIAINRSQSDKLRTGELYALALAKNA